MPDISLWGQYVLVEYASAGPWYIRTYHQMNATAAQNEQLRLLVQAVDDARMVNLGAAAALAWVAYDYCLTFSHEVLLIWPSRWSAAKILYLIIRYYTLFTLTINLAVVRSTLEPCAALRLTSELSCKDWFWYIGYNGPLLSTALGEALLLLRVNALYGWNTKVEIATAAVIVAVQVSASTVLPRPPNFPIPGCVAVSPPGIRLSLVAWVVVLVVSCCFFLFTFWKFITYINQVYDDEISFKNLHQFQRLAPTVHLAFGKCMLYADRAPRLTIFVDSRPASEPHIHRITFASRHTTDANRVNPLTFWYLCHANADRELSRWVMALYAILSTRVMHNLRDTGDRVAGLRGFEMSNLTAIAFDTPSIGGSRTLVGQDPSSRRSPLGTDSSSERSLHQTTLVK
ncbi:hypothetical protein BDN72DRAFT_859626 [Pluteus cervinus]|uniref:Uncharacterized protein n=1 Tax=Pluteus cervinus TaxID=181527 RepID=A0ACD3APC3_9AGAR|nr:hypothetical protein BDN72DRAFT_859626 [Pluteus cervinus]